MRKRLFTPTPQGIRPHDEGWLDLDRAASVEVTSEEKDHRIDSALVSGETQGWRAASPGTQTIRLLFDQPQRLRRIALAHFEKLCASSGISVLLKPHARSRNITLNCRMSPFLNWSSCRTSVEERLPPRSRVCTCFDSGARNQRNNARIECCVRLPSSSLSCHAVCSREPPSISILSNIRRGCSAGWK